MELPSLGDMLQVPRPVVVILGFEWVWVGVELTVPSSLNMTLDPFFNLLDVVCSVLKVITHLADFAA